jgi:hypothetical protein
MSSLQSISERDALAHFFGDVLPAVAADLKLASGGRRETGVWGGDLVRG